MELALDRGEQLGQVTVAEDAAKPPLDLEHADGRPAHGHLARAQGLTLRWVARTISIIDSTGFVEASTALSGR